MLVHANRGFKATFSLSATQPCEQGLVFSGAMAKLLAEETSEEQVTRLDELDTATADHTMSKASFSNVFNNDTVREQFFHCTGR